MPEFYAWFRFRCDSYVRFWKAIHTGRHAARPGIDVRFNDCWIYPEMLGFDLKGMAPYFDSIRAADYVEETGDPELMVAKRGFYHAVRRAVGLDKHFVTALSQRVRATPALIKETILDVRPVRRGRDDHRQLRHGHAGPAARRARGLRRGRDRGGGARPQRITWRVRVRGQVPSARRPAAGGGGGCGRRA